LQGDDVSVKCAEDFADPLPVLAMIQADGTVHIVTDDTQHRA
jgi:hypothetical protein